MRGGWSLIVSRRCAIAVGFVVAIVSAPAGADDFRCGVHIIDSGKQMVEVEDACGAPAQVTRSSIQRPSVVWIQGRPYSDGSYVDVAVETWVYNFGSARLMQQLRFEDGVLVDVNSLDYGHDDDSQ